MEQNLSNHARIVKPYHILLYFLLIAGLIGSIINLFGSIDNDNVYSASLLVLLFVICILISWYVRAFPLKAQDRAIRAEENFRHYLLTGKTFPPQLRMEQIIALRFAQDEEFPALTERSIQENLTGKAIKSAIKNWKADNYRV